MDGFHGGGFYVVERSFDLNGNPMYDQRVLSQPMAPISGDQEIDVARFPRGRRVAVWNNTAGRDGDENGIFGALFDRHLQRIGDEFQINLRHTDRLQREPSIAAGADTFLVAWTDYGNDVDAPQAVYGQLFGRNGQRLGEELSLAVAAQDYAALPSTAVVGAYGDEKYVVAYESAWQPQQGDGYDIAARFVGSDGVLGDRISLTSLPGRDDGNPTVAAASDGFVVTWAGYDQLGADVYLRRYTGDATPVGSEIRVNSFTEGIQAASDLAVSASDSVVVIWSSRDSSNSSNSQDGDGTGLFGQAFAPDGSPIGREFQVSTRSAGDQGQATNTADISFLNETDFVVVWQETFRTGDSFVHARLFRLTTDRRLCGDAVGQDLSVDVSDALEVLRVSAGLSSCALCSCDSDGSGSVGAPDALRVLKLAVGLQEQSLCTPCVSR
jgi:hypothetical protein